MANFKSILYKKVKKAQLNNFGIENFDEYRFGPFPLRNVSESDNPSILNKGEFKRKIKKTLLYNKSFNSKIVDDFVDLHLHEIEQVCSRISKRDRELYLNLIVYRLLGYKKVKLSRNNKEYWSAIEKVKSLVNDDEVYDPEFLHFLLKKVDLKPIGYDISFFLTEKGIAIDFLIEQYAFKNKNKKIVAAENGDFVFDLGACWGDTALYFADQVGSDGKVFSFEFIPKNIEIFKMNIGMNKFLEDRIELIEQPVTDKSNEIIFFKDNGPGSQVASISFPGQTGSCKTISIDDLVKEKNIKKVDFIKMDIEGAEPLALEGAIETITRFRPKLAIAIYHSLDDFTKIPLWILNLGLDYEIFIDHFSIHAEETICFAKPKLG